MALIRVVAMEEVKHVTIWVYFEGRANGISCQIGMECVGEERGQGDPKVFILSNWRNGVTVNCSEKKLRGEVWWGRTGGESGVSLGHENLRCL